MHTSPAHTPSESVSEKPTWPYITEAILSPLSDREREIMTLRYGFRDLEKKTLEEIGKLFNVTRERVRQMIRSSIQKIQATSSHEHMEQLYQHIIRNIEQFGGIISKKRLHTLLTGNDKERMMFEFILHELTHNAIAPLENDTFRDAVHLTGKPLDIFHSLARHIQAHINISHALHITDIAERLMTTDEFKQLKTNLPEGISERELVKNILESMSGISQSVFEYWGADEHPLIHPKRMKDKIYLVLKRVGKPMHFREIAEEINRSSFDKKKAYPPTVHNELILDKRFVLVGRGMYALTEWGYARGVVRDLIQKILKERGPLTRKEIEQEILKQRFIKPGTIYLALTNKNLFKKQGDTYRLATP